MTRNDMKFSLRFRVYDGDRDCEVLNERYLPIPCREAIVDLRVREADLLKSEFKSWDDAKQALDKWKKKADDMYYDKRYKVRIRVVEWMNL